MRSRALVLFSTVLVLCACGEAANEPTGTGGAATGGQGPGQGGAGGSDGGQGGQGAQGGGGAGGDGGQGGEGGAPTTLDELLDDLRADLDGALLAQSRAEGWPAPVVNGEQGAGHLFVSTNPSLTLLAGDHDGWTGTAMQTDQGFRWLWLEVDPGHAYKLTDGAVFEADPWARAYLYDDFGELSLVAPAVAHLERHFEVSGAGLLPRFVRVWVPQEPATHLLYAHDGQNLFDPGAIFGGWKLDESLPPAMMVVAIDNTPDRMAEYTHVPDDLGGGALGGKADDHAQMLETVVRPLVAQHYGEPATLGVMGSSLGGLVSLYVASQNPLDYTFAASLSGTMGWGSIGNGVTNTTMIDLWASLGHQPTALYVDSGGGGTCVDADQDGIEDDGNDSDNYCVNKQLEATLLSVGYQADLDFWHWHEPGAPHNEVAWSQRVWRPLSIFAGL